MCIVIHVFNFVTLTLISAPPENRHPYHEPCLTRKKLGLAQGDMRYSSIWASFQTHVVHYFTTLFTSPNICIWRRYSVLGSYFDRLVLGCLVTRSSWVGAHPSTTSPTTHIRGFITHHISTVGVKHNTLCMFWMVLISLFYDCSNVHDIKSIIPSEWVGRESGPIHFIDWRFPTNQNSYCSHFNSLQNYILQLISARLRSSVVYSELNSKARLLKTKPLSVVPQFCRTECFERSLAVLAAENAVWSDCIQTYNFLHPLHFHLEIQFFVISQSPPSN